MEKQNINIIGHKILYDILDEIKNYLSFRIINFINEEEYLNSTMANKENIKNSLYIVKKLSANFFNKISINKNQIFTISDEKIEIFKLIEKINIQLIRKKYLNQSKVSFGDYILDVNSREISKDNVKLKLTEKEIDTIIFLGEKKTPQSIKDLLHNVWGYVAEIESHTVETHIYRLRKKIFSKFRDENFIKSHDKGYQIQ